MSTKGQAEKNKSGATKPRKPNPGQFKKGHTAGQKTQFKKGNTIGSETRIKPGEKLASVYQEKYPDSMLEYAMREDVIYPSLEGWCMSENVAIRTAYDWLESHPRFADVYSQLKYVQKQRLEERGLTNRYNPQIVKFLLENNHGMKEKKETEISGSAVTINLHEVE